MITPNVLIISGEISGDLYAAQLATTLSHAYTTFGIGGDKLESSCDHYLLNIAHKNKIGFEALFQFKLKKDLRSVLEKQLTSETIDCAVMIDFQHHNQWIANILQQHHIPIITFITPNFWIWKDKRKAKKLIHYSEEIVTIFKREYDFYRSITPHTHFFGHPLAYLPQETEHTLKVNDEITPIAIFPGSRDQELDLYLNPLFESLSQLKHTEQKPFHFFIALSSEQFRQRISDAITTHHLNDVAEFWEGDSESLIKQTKAMICASGTTTLRGILNLKPMVVLCALSPVTYWIAKYILRLKIEHISLPNIIANDVIVSELIQKKITPKNIVRNFHEELSQSEETIQKKYSSIINELIIKNPFTEIGLLIGKTIQKNLHSDRV